MESRLLVVEDDPQVGSMLVRMLGYEGFQVDWAQDGASALEKIAKSAPDLVLLDLLLPDIDGVEVCQRIRTTSAGLPVLMLTARDQEDDKVLGLDTGADDYMVKPFSTAELVARVRALLRRARMRRETPERKFADLTLNAATREVFRGSRLIELTRREFDLLAMFMERPRVVLDRETLLTEAWGYPPELAESTNVVDVYVGYLRRKLEDSTEPRLIWTVRGTGWVLREARP